MNKKINAPSFFRVLQSIHDCKQLYCISSWVPSCLVIGGDKSFIRRLIWISVSPKVGSIYNMGLWDNTLGTCVWVHKRRTLALEAAARKHYRETSRSPNNGGCVGEPHILHCCMATGRLQVAFIEACLEELPKDTAAAVQRQPY